MRPHLVELGQRAVAAVAAGIAAGAPLTKCQLLASEFYEALQLDLRSSTDDAHRRAVVAALRRCERVAAANIGPTAMLNELQNALVTLQTAGAGIHVEQTSRPMLRVIKGGLSTA
jgi:hypothetical protein